MTLTIIQGHGTLYNVPSNMYEFQRRHSRLLKSLLSIDFRGVLRIIRSKTHYRCGQSKAHCSIGFMTAGSVYTRRPLDGEKL